MPYVETIELLPASQLAELGERVLDALDRDQALSPVSRGDLTRLRSEESRAEDPLLARRVAEWVEVNQAALFTSYPGPLPPFDHLRDFWFNFFEGPRSELPQLPLHYKVQPTRFLGLPLSFPFGVPACALTPQSSYVRYFSSLGFDLITYKTVRERPWNPHAFPQWAFVPEVRRPFAEADLNDEDQLAQSVMATLDPAAVTNPSEVSLTNSFGVPSLDVETWKSDIAVSKQLMRAGQILIVSVMGSGDDPETKTDRDMIGQFANAAWHAYEAGADIVELNLSCPNTDRKLICRNAQLSAEVARAVHERLKGTGTPIMIKISYLNEFLLGELVETCEPFIQGIVAINTVSAPTRAAGTDDAFFPGRPTAGLSGLAIRDLGLLTAQRLVELRTKRAGDWAIVGVGGVTTPDDYSAYRAIGVDAVQSCSGAWANPLLALQTREQYGRLSSQGRIRAVLDGAASAGAAAFRGAPLPAAK